MNREPLGESYWLSFSLLSWPERFGHRITLPVAIKSLSRKSLTD